jgi:site-specific recombinase XerD
MGEWLVDQNYLARNPFSVCPAVAIGARIDVSGRSLSHGQWRNVVQATSRVRYSQHELRDYLALNLAYSTGLRRSELADATTGRLTRTAPLNPADQGWQLSISGKGHAARTVLVPQTVMELVFASLRARGLPGNPDACPPDTPLLAHFRTGDPLTPDGLGQVFRRLFLWAAPRSGTQSERNERKCAHPSTHWIRHTHSHHALENGANCREVQVRLGHAHLSTTRLYLKAGSRARALQR